MRSSKFKSIPLTWQHKNPAAIITDTASTVHKKWWLFDWRWEDFFGCYFFTNTTTGSKVKEHNNITSPLYHHQQKRQQFFKSNSFSGANRLCLKNYPSLFALLVSLDKSWRDNNNSLLSLLATTHSIHTQTAAVATRLKYARSRSIIYITRKM